MKTVFEPHKLNETLTLKNRIIMAPLTRAFADKDNVPTEQMTDYYARRADTGLIISEATVIRRDGFGYYSVPGIFTQKQIDGWKHVTNKVHKNNGTIFSQLWHVGRVSHPEFLNGELPVSASATQMHERIRRVENLYYDKSRALELNEIPQLVADYRQAALNAMEAGFDGVEIHGANGYLIDQFLHHSTNLREDEYGKTPENMARFALEIVQTIVDAIGADRVGIRLSPGAYLNEVTGDPRDAANFQYLLEQLNQLNLAYVHTGNFDDSVRFPELDNKTMTEFLRSHYQGTLIASGMYSLEIAETQINNDDFDLIAIGRPFIANPDFIERSKAEKPLIQYDAEMLKTLI